MPNWRFEQTPGAALAPALLNRHSVIRTVRVEQACAAKFRQAFKTGPNSVLSKMGTEMQWIRRITGRFNGRLGGFARQATADRPFRYTDQWESVE